MSTYRIGRNNDNDVVVNDSTNTVSGNHALIEKIGKQFYITDTSRNGTFVNGQKIPTNMRFPVSTKDSIVLAKFPFDWNSIDEGSDDRPFIYYFLQNNYKYVVLFLLVIGISYGGYKLLTSFSKKEQLATTDLYNKYKNSVLLIYNKFYHTIEFEDNPVCYIGYDSRGMMSYSFDKNEIYPFSCTGTGFFVSNQGEIITNRHVAYPWKTHQNEIEFSNKEPILYQVYAEAKYKVERDLRRNLGTSQFKISRGGESVFVGYALDNTFINIDNPEDDFFESVQIKHHENQLIDLALIQSKDKSLPPKSNYINVEKVINSKNIQVGDEATIIGFPGGISFQNLNGNAVELNVITNDGKINQPPTNEDVMYSTATTHGASGSPVFNEKGELIAVNFGGFSDGFNKGVLSKYIKDLVE